MGSEDIYSKSSLGLEEVSSRKMKLSPRMRTMLILIDGRVPVFVLREEAQRVGAASDFLEQLQALGLIVKTGSVAVQKTESAPESSESTNEFAMFRQAQDFMNVTAVNSLGLKSFFFTLKLERASNIVELRELLPSYQAAIAKGSGIDEAEVLAHRLHVMLADHQN